jgi:hypothetical protein
MTKITKPINNSQGRTRAAKNQVKGLAAMKVERPNLLEIDSLRAW